MWPFLRRFKALNLRFSILDFLRPRENPEQMSLQLG